MAQDQVRDPNKLQQATILLLVAAVTVAFLGVVHDFIAALFLAMVFSSMAAPLYRLLLELSGGRTQLASIACLTILILLVVIPLLILLFVVASQAYQMTEALVPWVQEQIHQSQGFKFQLPAWVPFRDQLQISSSQVVSKISEFTGQVGSFLVQSLSAATQGTAHFFLNLFIMLYAMYFFLKDGPAIGDRLLRYLPLSSDAKRQLADKGLSVARATLRGTVVIGALQGLLAGFAFAVAGIDGAVLWGAVTALASVVPGIGTALVWVPAVGYLVITGKIWTGILLTLWCAAFIGSVDNVLRPCLVGNDTEMPDLLILISTLGGLAMFGIIGLIVGPVIAGLFITAWDIFEVCFQPGVPEADINRTTPPRQTGAGDLG